MSEEEKNLVRLVVSYARKMKVQGVVGPSMSGEGIVDVGVQVSMPTHEVAQKAAEELFKRLRAS